MKKVFVKSKQKDIIVKKHSPNFRYGFASDPVEMPEEHANILIKSSNFSIVEGKLTDVPDLDIMDIKQLRKYAKDNNLKSKDTSENELRDEIKEELKGDKK